MVYLNKTVSNEMLVFESNFGVLHKSHDSSVINQDITAMCSTRNRLSHTFFHYFGCKIPTPTLSAKAMTTFQSGH